MLYRRVKNTLQIKHSQKRSSPQIGIEWYAHKNFLSEELIRLSRLVTTSFTGRTQTSQDERGPSTQPSVRIKRAGRRGAVHRAFCWRENGSINSARKIGSLLPLFSSTIQLRNRTFVTVSVRAMVSLSLSSLKLLRDL